MLPSSSRINSGGGVISGGDERIGVRAEGERGDEDNVGTVRVDDGVGVNDDRNGESVVRGVLRMSPPLTPIELRMRRRVVNFILFYSSFPPLVVLLTTFLSQVLLYPDSQSRTLLLKNTPTQNRKRIPSKKCLSRLEKPQSKQQKSKAEKEGRD